MASSWIPTQWKIQVRYVIAAMNFLALALSLHFRSVLSAAFPEMIRTRQENETNLLPTSDDKFIWDEESQGIILGAFHWGYILTPLIGGMIADKFGGKHVLGATILLSAVCTALHPTAARAGYLWMIALRILFGLSQGPLYSAVSTLMSKWVPDKELDVYGGIIYGGSQLGVVSGNLLTGGLLSLFPTDWSFPFYVSSGLGLVWIIFFYLLCSNSPEDHPFISDEEKLYLKGRIKAKECRRPPIPWRTLLTSRPVNAFLLGGLGSFWSAYLMMADLPKYMKQVMHFSLFMNGLMSSLPFLIMWIVSTMSGLISSKVNSYFKISTTTSRKIFTSVALVFSIVGQIGAAFLDNNATAVITFLSFGLGALGMLNAGLELIPNDISPNFAGTIMALSTVYACAGGVLAPYLVGIIAPNQTPEEWRTILLISSGINFVALISFNSLASSEVQKWNAVDLETEIYDSNSRQKNDSDEVSR